MCFSCCFSAHLLRGSGRGTGISRRSPAPHRSPRRSACTGFCCPTAAALQPPPPPASPARRETGSAHPDPGSGASASASCRLAGTVFLREMLEIVTGICLLMTFSTRPSDPGRLNCFVSKIKAGWQLELCWCWLMCNVHSRLGYFWLSEAQSFLSIDFIYFYSVSFRELSISFYFIF